MLDHIGELRIAIKDQALRTDGDGTFSHFFNEHPVGMICSFQCIQLMALFSLYHKGIDLPGSDRFNGFICFIQLKPKLFQLLQ